MHLDDMDLPPAACLPARPARPDGDAISRRIVVTAFAVMGLFCLAPLLGSAGTGVALLVSLPLTFALLRPYLPAGTHGPLAATGYTAVVVVLLAL